MLQQQRPQPGRAGRRAGRQRDASLFAGAPRLVNIQLLHDLLPLIAAQLTLLLLLLLHRRLHRRLGLVLLLLLLNLQVHSEFRRIPHARVNVVHLAGADARELKLLPHELQLRVQVLHHVLLPKDVALGNLPLVPLPRRVRAHGLRAARGLVVHRPRVTARGAARAGVER